MKSLLICKHKLLFVIISTLLSLTPFLTKAFHIDDAIIIYFARQIIKTSFLGFPDTAVNWLGIPQNLRALSDSPLISRYAALIISITRENEFWLHLSFLIFPIIAAISMYFLSKRFSKQPLLSTLLLTSTPAFMISATNIMPDLALFALYLAGICVFIYGIDKENKSLLIVAGFIAGLASLAKYSGLTLIPLFFIYSILKRKLSKGLLALFIFFAVLGIWYLQDFILFGKIQIVKGLYWFKPTFSSIISNTLGSLTYLSSITVFPLLFLLLMEKKKDCFIYFFMIWLSTLLFINESSKFKYTTSQIILSVIFISTSILILQKFIKFLKEKNISNYTDIIFLLVWFGGIFCYNVFILTWLTAPRYTLILTPPLILLLMKRYDLLIAQRIGNMSRDIIYTGIVLNFLLSILISYADYTYADTYRNFTQTYTKYLKEKDSKVWFRGHWGFQYYMEKEGFSYLGLEDIPQKGEIIIMPSACDYEPLSQDLKERLKLIGTIKYESPYPLRTVSSKDRICFYAYAMGSLSYGISNEPLEVFQIWQAE